MFDEIILKKLRYSVAKPTKPDDREHFPYSDGVTLHTLKLPKDNDPVMPYGTATLKKTIKH